MITKHLATITAAFNPLKPVPAHKIPRLLLSFISPSARAPGGVKVSQEILPASSPRPSEITLAFRDGRELKFLEMTRKGKSVGKADAKPADGVFDLGKLGIKDVVEEVDRHSRMLQRKAELSGN